MSNPESTDMEFGIHSVESGIQDSRGLPYMGRYVSSLIETCDEKKELVCPLLATVCN